ncbi:MAG: ABC transporter substrate-binding protein [Zetaproteobacteria bacterium]|nr:ABC transporter substrate-binding protein [Zetaproteobacteria bacterium]
MMRYVKILWLGWWSCWILFPFAHVSASALTLGWSKMPRSVDPRFASDEGSFILSQMTHCALIGHNQQHQPVGHLAKDWAWKSDTELLVNLKENVFFADGTPVDAQAVKHTYDYLRQSSGLKNPSPFVGAFRDLESVRVVSPTRLVFVLKKYREFFPDDLVVGILPPKFVQDKQVSVRDQVQGCGPFVLQQQSLLGLSLVANPKYSLGPVAQVTKLHIRVVKDSSTMLAKLIKHEIDLAHEMLTFDSYARIEKQHTDLKLYVTHLPQTSYVGFNMEHPILKHKLVRRAIAMAIDREAILKYILDGRAEVAHTFLPPQNRFYAANTPKLAFDVKKAQQLLEEAGYPVDPSKGVRFGLKLSTSNSDMSMAFAQTIASNLSKIGIAVQHRSSEWAKFKLDLEKGRAQMWILQSVGIKTPEIYQAMLSQKRIPPHGPNRGRFIHAGLEKLFGEVEATRDAEQLQALYARIQHVTAEEAPYAFLFHNHLIYVAAKSVRGMEQSQSLDYAQLMTRLSRADVASSR